MTDDELREILANLALSQVKTDAQLAKTDAQLEEEYDLLLVNGNELFIVEVKYRLHSKDVDYLLGRKRANFIKLFPEYRHYKIHLALAGFAVEDNVKRQALDQGVTILQRRGNVVETIAA